MRIWFSALILLLLGAVRPGVAFAHAELERSDPPVGSTVAQSPGQLRLTFTEPVDGSFSRVQVLNSQRDEIDSGDSHVAPDDQRALIVSLPSGLTDGLYTVSWRTLSAVDGHTVNGAYPLVFGALPAGAQAVAATSSTAQASFAPETAVGRFWLYSTAGAILGLLLTWHLVFGALLPVHPGVARRKVAARTRIVALIVCGLLVVGTVYGAIAQAAVAADTSLLKAVGSPLVDVLSRGRYAAIWWPRFALVLVLIGLLVLRGVTGRTGLVALGAAAAVLLTASLTSHGAALASGPYLGIAADWLHLLSVGAWLGGLTSLLLVLPRALSATSGGGLPLLARAVRRFSNIALVAVGVIVVTGTFQAWLEVGTWDGLFQTLYGMSVLAKIGLLCLMLALGAFNLLIVRRRLIRFAQAGAGAADTAWRRLAGHLTWSIRGEAVLGLVVLAVAALLTGLEPARSELARLSGGENQVGPVDRGVNAEGLPVRVLINPAALGVNHFAVEVPGVDPASVERVQLTLTFLDGELGSQPLVLDPVPSSNPPGWAADSPLLSQPGAWQAQLLVRRTGLDDARSAIRFTVTGPGSSAAVAAAPAAGVYPLLPSPLTTLSYLLIGGGLVFGYVMYQRGQRQHVRRAWATLMAAGLVVVCGGYVYAEEQLVGPPVDVTNVRNPTPPDDRSLTSGRATYAANCAVCHGDDGRGDGPAAPSLNPPPADLRVHMAAGHTDGQLFYWVSYGFPNTAMPAWQSQLSEDERWDVINFIRTFANT